MSWQDYVDKQLMASRCVTKAAIAGHDGNVWAKSEGFEVSFSSVKIIPKESVNFTFPLLVLKMCHIVLSSAVQIM